MYKRQMRVSPQGAWLLGCAETKSDWFFKEGMAAFEEADTLAISAAAQPTCAFVDQPKIGALACSPLGPRPNCFQAALCSAVMSCLSSPAGPDSTPKGFRFQKRGQEHAGGQIRTG